MFLFYFVEANLWTPRENLFNINRIYKTIIFRCDQRVGRGERMKPLTICIRTILAAPGGSWLPGDGSGEPSGSPKIIGLEPIRVLEWEAA